MNKTYTHPVRAGQQGTIQTQLIANVEDSTAIGNSVANYYVVEIISNLGGCTCCGPNEPIVRKNVYIEAPPLVPPMRPHLDMPKGWNPQVAPKMAHFGMPIMIF